MRALEAEPLSAQGVVPGFAGAGVGHGAYIALQSRRSPIPAVVGP